MFYRILALTVIVIILAVGIISFLGVAPADLAKKRVCFGNNCVTAEVADTFASRALGLMFREKLDKNRGMLFVFSKEGIHSFWMQNTLIPLDIIWINKDFKVVDIKTATPCKSLKCPSYTPKSAAQYVVEVNAGFCEENRVEVGDTAVIK